MAKKYEFKPDKTGTGFLNKLYLTQLQRQALLKWSLYGLVLLVLTLLQDVLLCSLSLFGSTTDLVPTAIILITVMLGAESGCLFALIGTCFYQFSGSSPGYHVIAILTFLAVGATIFRQSYLQRGFSASMLCSGAALLLYEVIIFAVGLVFGQTTIVRFPAALLTVALSGICLPILHPILLSIEKIGGDVWKE